MGQLIIQGVTLYYDGVSVTNKFETPTYIVGPGRITIPIVDQSNNGMKELIVRRNKSVVNE